MSLSRITTSVWALEEITDIDYEHELMVLGISHWMDRLDCLSIVRLEPTPFLLREFCNLFGHGPIGSQVGSALDSIHVKRPKKAVSHPIYKSLVHARYLGHCFQAYQ